MKLNTHLECFAMSNDLLTVCSMKEIEVYLVCEIVISKLPP